MIGLFCNLGSNYYVAHSHFGTAPAFKQRFQPIFVTQPHNVLANYIYTRDEYGFAKLCFSMIEPYQDALRCLNRWCD